MGVMTAAAFMQLAFGWIVGAFAQAAGAPPEHAYRAAFAAQAAAALLAIAIYAPIRDVKPRGVTASSTSAPRRPEDAEHGEAGQRQSRRPSGRACV